jgi:CelD/BcsL family acetyltransferase involved in cellulose biosynthesis
MARVSSVALAKASSPAATVALQELHVTDARWHSLVAGHPETLAFHRPEWAETIADCYGHRPFVVGAVDDNGDVDAGVPLIEVRSVRRRRRWIALPFTDCCAPLLGPSVGSGGFVAALGKARTDAGIESLELRSPWPAGRGVHPHGGAVIHTTPLARRPDEVFARFHKSQVQRNVRRAEREQKLTIRRGERARDLTKSYYALHVQTRRRLGMPVQPRRFFEALWSHMLAPGHGSLLLAVADDGAPVAGAVFLAGTRTLTYKYGASDAAFWHLRPNHLLFWHALRTACEDGYDRFDWGRTDLADHGLRAFKSGWAADEVPLVYTTLADEAPRARSGRGLAAGRIALRRSPPFVCRLAGELLYRFAA